MECQGHLKSNIKYRITNSKLHTHKFEELLNKCLDYNTRNRKVGLNLIRLIYTGLRQNKPRSSFDILTAKLNRRDTGDINHSRFFVKNLDTDTTYQKKPVGMVMETKVVKA